MEPYIKLDCELPDFDQQDKDYEFNMRIGFAIIFVGVLFFLLTASVSAGEITLVGDGAISIKGTPPHILTDSCGRAIGIDTTRYYAKVDTCLTCPDDFTMDTVPYIWPVMPEKPLPIELYCKHPCRPDSDVYPDTTFTTTWLPKVQRWYTPEELAVLDAWIWSQLPCSVTGHDWQPSGLGWCCDPSGQIYYCMKCDESLDVPNGKTPAQIEKLMEMVE